MTEKGVEMIRRKSLWEKLSPAIFICTMCVTFYLPLAASCQAGNPMHIVLLNDTGEKVRLGQMATGKPLLLYFWATWCRPCRHARPKVSDFAQKYEDRVKVLGINLGGLDSLEEVRKYRSRHKITYPLLLDRDNEVAEAYSVYTIPTVILLDSNGEIRHRGDNPPANLEGLLSK